MTALIRLLPCFAFAACAVSPASDPGSDPTAGKADGSGATTAATWTREVIDNNSTLWNGGPVGWGAGTSIALRADGEPIIAYYDASYHCNNGGFGTYSPDALMVARANPQGWSKRIEACGPQTGYWPRLRVDDSDRTHVVFGAGWYTSGQRAFYVRWNAAGGREVSKLVDAGYMSSGALALTLDDAGAPIIVSNGKLYADDGTKKTLFTDSTSQTFIDRDSASGLHTVGSTLIPEPNMPGTSISRMRYAHTTASGTTVEIPRADQPVAIPLGLVVDSHDHPHILSWNTVPMGVGELWHSTRTANGWVSERIATDVSRSAAMALGNDDELLVVTSGRLLRHPAGASQWITNTVSQLASASNPSLAVAPDGTIHVAFQVVGSIMSNSVSRAPVYHATLRP